MHEPNAEEFRGRALLDGVSALLPVSAQGLLPLGAAFPGVSLPEPDAAGDLSVLVECWRVRDGQPEAAGLSYHALSESAGAAGAALVSGISTAVSAAIPAGLIAAGAGAAAGSRSGPLASMFMAALCGGGGALSGGTLAGVRAAGADARLGGLLARAWSERFVSSWGSYNEILIALPGVLLAGRPYALVVAMVTDSAFARAVDRGLAYGFGKRRASFVSRRGSLNVYAPDYRLLLSMRLQGGANGPENAGAWETLEQAQSLPLLGYLGGGNYASSRLLRQMQGNARAEACEVRFEFGEAGLAPLAGRSFTARACTARAAYGALTYRNVLARIGAPERAPTASEHYPMETT